MSEHTKGPWESDEGRDYHQDHILIRTANKEIGLAVVRGWDGVPSREECLANARLIAAAPALLEACEKALMNSTRSRSADCVFCGAAIGEEHAKDCPTMPLRAAIRAAREGK